MINIELDEVIYTTKYSYLQNSYVCSFPTFASKFHEKVLKFWACTCINFFCNDLINARAQSELSEMSNMGFFGETFNSCRLLPIFIKKFHLRRLTGFWIRLCNDVAWFLLLFTTPTCFLENVTILSADTFIYENTNYSICKKNKSYQYDLVL